MLLNQEPDDSLKIEQQEDGSFLVDWDKDDPNWSWLNNLSSSEVEIMLKQAILEELNNES